MYLCIIFLVKMMSFVKLDESPTVSPKLSNSEQTPFVHLYRAEIQRLVVYKQRLDTTINWTISIHMFLWSIYLSNIDFVDIYEIITMIVSSQIVIMIFDVNRYVNYYDSRYRCKLMEDGMYSVILDENVGVHNWKTLLLDTWVGYDTNYKKIRPSKWKLLFLRFRNVYIYLTFLNFIIFLFFQYYL